MEHSRVLLQKNEMFSLSFPFFAKERCVCCVLCKRMLPSLRSFLFFRKERKRTEKNGKERKRTEHSFGSHKSPKTRKKNGTFLLKNGKYRTEKNAVPNPGESWGQKCVRGWFLMTCHWLDSGPLLLQHHINTSGHNNVLSRVPEPILTGSGPENIPEPKKVQKAAFSASFSAANGG